MPRKLFQYFDGHGYSIAAPANGIYYIKGNTTFPVQVIVTKGLNKDAHAWLRALSGNLKKEDIEELLGNMRSLTETADREMVD